MKKRQKFQCCGCRKTFSLFLEITEEQTLIVPCPFCAAECVAELTPHYKKETVRGTSQDAPEVLDLPDALPTKSKQVTLEA